MTRLVRRVERVEVRRVEQVELVVSSICRAVLFDKLDTA